MSKNRGSRIIGCALQFPRAHVGSRQIEVDAGLQQLLADVRPAEDPIEHLLPRKRRKQGVSAQRYVPRRRRQRLRANAAPPPLVKAAPIPVSLRLDQVGQPEHGVPRADRRSRNHFHFVQSIVFGQKPVNRLHRAGLVGAFGPAAGKNEADSTHAGQGIACHCSRLWNLRWTVRVGVWLQPESDQDPVQERRRVVGDQQSEKKQCNDDQRVTERAQADGDRSAGDSRQLRFEKPCKNAYCGLRQVLVQKPEAGKHPPQAQRCERQGESERQPNEHPAERAQQCVHVASVRKSTACMTMVEQLVRKLSIRGARQSSRTRALGRWRRA